MGVVGCAWVPIVIVYLLCYCIVLWTSSLIPRFRRHASVRSAEAVAQLCTIFLLATYFMSSCMAFEAMLDSSFDETLAIVMTVLGLGIPTFCLCAALASARTEHEEGHSRRPANQLRSEE